MKYNRKEFIKTAGMGGLSVAFALNRLPVKLSGKRLIKPKLLSYGDTIGMISPASSLPETVSYEEVAGRIKKLGFKVKMAEHAKSIFGYFAGTDKNRAEDLNAMFADDEVDGIIPFRGGWGCNRVLEYIDFELIEKKPKPLIGFSDITSLLLSIHAKTGMITYHGPVGKSHWTDYTISHFKKALMQPEVFSLQNHSGEIETITTGKAEGKLLGGNLSVLTAMIGSGYLPEWDNCILFLEDVGEAIYRVDRMLTQLRLAGVFEKINGFIFGKCTNCDPESGPHFTLKQIIKQHIAPFNIPVYMGANIGHIDDMITLPVGLQAEIDAGKGVIRLQEAPVAKL